MLFNPIEKVYLLGDGNSRLGMGHIMRLFSVSSNLVNIGIHEFCLIASDVRTQNFLESHGCVWNKLANKSALIELVTKKDIVIIDGYQYTSAFLQELRNTGSRIIYIDDLHDRYLPVDMVINHTPGYKRSDYNIPDHTLLFLGPDYCMIRQAFLQKRRRKRIVKLKKVVLTLGMSDSGPLLSNLLEMLLEVLFETEITVLQGSNVIPPHLNDHPRVEILPYLGEQEMAALFDRMDLAVVPLSTLYLEALSRNTLVAGGFFVDNQEVVYNQVSRTGIFFGLGDLRIIEQNKLETSFAQIQMGLPSTINNSFGIGWSKVVESIRSWES